MDDIADFIFKVIHQIETYEMWNEFTNHSEVFIRELHVVRDEHGKPIDLKVVASCRPISMEIEKMDNTTKKSIVVVVAGLAYTGLWALLTLLILLRIDATMVMWAVFVLIVPLRLVIEVASKKVLVEFKEERDLE